MRTKRVTQRFGLHTVALAIAVFAAGAFSQSPETTKASTATGDLRLHDFSSRIFGNSRTIRVLLPPHYDEHPKVKYRVLYLNDGQNLFDLATAQFNPMEWRVDETIGRLIESGEIPPVIVVGIDNAGKRMRPNEYLPWEDKFLSPPMPKPNGAKYPEFLVDEVLPFIEQRYRVKTGAENTGLGGSSYGALIALYTVIKKPGVFGRLLLESPSFYVSDARVLADARSVAKWPKRIYVGVGTNEEGAKKCDPSGDGGEAVRDVQRFRDIVLKSGFDPKRLSVVVEECAVHNEEAWAGRLPAALKFLYGNQ